MARQRAITPAGGWELQLVEVGSGRASGLVGRPYIPRVVLVADQRPAPRERERGRARRLWCWSRELVVALRGVPVGYGDGARRCRRVSRGRRPRRADSPRLRPRGRAPPGRMATRSSPGVPAGERRGSPRCRGGRSLSRSRRAVQRRHSPGRATRARVPPDRRRRRSPMSRGTSRSGSRRATGWDTYAYTSTTPTPSCTRQTRSTTWYTPRIPSGTPRRTSSRSSRRRPAGASSASWPPATREPSSHTCRGRIRSESRPTATGSRR